MSLTILLSSALPHNNDVKDSIRKAYPIVDDIYIEKNHVRTHYYKITPPPQPRSYRSYYGSSILHECNIMRDNFLPR